MLTLVGRLGEEVLHAGFHRDFDLILNQVAGVVSLSLARGDQLQLKPVGRQLPDVRSGELREEHAAFAAVDVQLLSCLRSAPYPAPSLGPKM